MPAVAAAATAVAKVGGVAVAVVVLQVLDGMSPWWRASHDDSAGGQEELFIHECFDHLNRLLRF